MDVRPSTSNLDCEKMSNEISSDMSDVEDCDLEFCMYSDHNTDSEEEAADDVDDDCDEKFYMHSDHNTEFEEEAADNVGEVRIKQERMDEPAENSSYFYGKNRFQWSSLPATSSRGLSGLRSPAEALGRKASPLDIWELFFTEEICSTILHWTNHKIEKQRSHYKNKQSASLKNIDKTELYAFFGLLAYTALFKSNHESIDTLFATDGTGREIIKCIMSKERFTFLLLCLRFGNLEVSKVSRLNNPAAPISKIFDIFVQNCQTCYSIGEAVCIDEMLVAFRGRCKFKMYIPNKPNKYGLKLMCCTDAQTGYFYNGYIYTGTDSDGTGLLDEDKKYSKPSQSVIRLTQPIYNTNRSITFDNWFTSIELVTVMKQKGLTCIGTIRKNEKEIPPQFLPQKYRIVGSTLYGFTKDVTLVSYVPRKNKAVILVSSSHHHESDDPVTGKPHIMLDYNSTKGGVDALDEECSKFSCSRRSRRWPLTIFYRMFDISSVNSYILHNSYPENPQLQRPDFIKNLASQLVTPHLQNKANNVLVPRKLQLCISEILGENKKNIPQERVEKLEKRKNCSICSYKKRRKTAYVCYNCQRPICLECSKKLCVNCV